VQHVCNTTLQCNLFPGTASCKPIRNFSLPATVNAIVTDQCSCSNNPWQQKCFLILKEFIMYKWILIESDLTDITSKFHATTSVIAENNISYICHRNIYNLHYTIFYIFTLTIENWITVLHGHILFCILQNNHINKINIIF